MAGAAALTGVEAFGGVSGQKDTHTRARLSSLKENKEEAKVLSVFCCQETVAVTLPRRLSRAVKVIQLLLAK